MQNDPNLRKSRKLLGQSGKRYFTLLGILLIFPVLGILSAYYPPVIILFLLAITLGAILFFSVEPLILGALFIRRILDIQTAFGFRPFFVEYANILNVALAALLVIASVWWIVYKKVKFQQYPLIWPWFVLLIISGISILYSVDSLNTFQQWLRLVSYAAIYLLMIMVVRTRQQVYRVLAILLLSTLIPNMVAMNEVITSAAFKYLDVARVKESMGSGPAHGQFLIIPILITTMLFARAKSFRLRLLYSVLLISMGVPFFYSLARGAWVGVTLAVFFIGFSTRNTRQMIPYVILILFLVGIVFLVPAIRVRLLAFTDSDIDSSLVNRIQIWKSALSLFYSSPIFGVGLGTADKLAASNALGVNIPVHNDIVRVLADIGVIGLLTYFYLYISLLLQMVSLRSTLHTSFYRSLATVGIGIWIAYQFAGLFNNVFTNSTIQYGYWGFAGMLASLPFVEKNGR